MPDGVDRVVKWPADGAVEACTRRQQGLQRDVLLPLFEPMERILGNAEAMLYFATAASVAAWICYMALEPYVRRYWPRTMISWSRLVKGHCRDPLLGRDLLSVQDLASWTRANEVQDHDGE